MDVLSDAISAVRVGRPSSTRLRVAGTWCARVAAYDGAGFLVALRGSCWLLPDGGGPPLTLGPGDVVLLPHGTGYVLASGPMEPQAVERAVIFEEWEARRTAPPPANAPALAELLCGKYLLDGRHRHPLMAELPDVIHLPNRVGDHVELRSAIELLGREVTQDAPGAGVVLPGLLDLLLVYLVRAWMAQEPAATDWSAALADPAVAAALRALHEAPERPWSNELLAARAGVSRATLGRRFTMLVGRTPMAYLAWWRMTRAATLLRDTEAPIDTIARQVGYGSPYALSHAFNRAFGTTPGRYRAARSGG
ncbi:AraC family transcriptional regulator [Kitasatospora sp. NBC_01287]|uniref:AraC family transcriptional regulator n=1 Tax=Kitasatospora sp. NBC_01287 TaxID=2903573 RepID=UPI00224FFBB8|nr:AraC family transcriptional regulator [Kitasatospora sp. NBC_01287]MCX4747823.1 AraC family transcriptional regulator [Kitasatospora sp. NBC_01287]